MLILLGKRGLSLQIPAAFYPRSSPEETSVPARREEGRLCSQVYGGFIGPILKETTKDDPCGCGSSFI